MTTLTVQQAADWWKAEGGPDNSVVAWISVGIAESSLNTEAVSPTGAVGLYQLEPYSWPATLGSFDRATDAGYNTLAAITLSGGGMNFAPWDTAYADIYSSGRYSFLNWPEPHSAAWNNMGYVALTLGHVYNGIIKPPGEPGITGTLPDALNWYGQVTHGALPGLNRRAARISARAARGYTGR